MRLECLSDMARGDAAAEAVLVVDAPGVNMAGGREGQAVV